MTDSRQALRQTQKQAKKKTKKKKNLLPKILAWLFGLFLLALVAGAGLFAYYASSTPDITAADLDGAIQTKILDKDGQLVTEIGGENRDLLTESQVPQTLKDAVISIEDKRFYSHIGIDPIRIASSFINNLRSDTLQGGSTITQQLIKLSKFSTNAEDQTYQRKAQEAVLALKIEREYSKEQILTYYLNKVYLANNVYGFATAANYYYGTSIDQLSLAQTALLAGMPQAPNSYDPYAHPEAAQKRRDTVLAMMLANKKIDQAQYQAAIAVPIDQGLVDHSQDLSENDQNLIFDSFISMVMEEVKEKTGLDPYSDGLTIETTVDSGAQKELYQILNTTDYIQYIDDRIQNAVVMLDAQTGAIRAINGGRKQTTLLAYNRAIQSDRSTGSTIKPIIDYGPAIEALNYSTGQTIVDKPITYSNGFELNNWDQQYMGTMTMRQALVLSRNTTAYQTFKAVGNEAINDFLKQLNLTIVNGGQEGLVESNSIGANLSPLDMAAAYAAFANYGVYSTPYTVTKVTTRTGQVYSFEPQQHQAMKDSTAYMITDMLKDSFKYGFATNEVIPGVYQAAKTGSTNYTAEQLTAMGASDGEFLIPDSWFIGYSPAYAISVWTGYDDPYQPGNGVNGVENEYSKRIYYYLMQYASQFINNEDWIKPDSVVSAQIEVGSNPLSLPGPRTPSNLISTELFVKGTVPTQESLAYGQALDTPSGFTASYDKAKKVLTVKWNPVTSPNNQKVSYQVTVGDQSQTVTKTEARFTNITQSKLSLSLIATAGNYSSDPLYLDLELETEETTEETTEDSTTTAEDDNPSDTTETSHETTSSE